MCITDGMYLKTFMSPEPGISAKASSISGMNLVTKLVLIVLTVVFLPEHFVLLRLMKVDDGVCSNTLMSPKPKNIGGSSVKGSDNK